MEVDRGPIPSGELRYHLESPEQFYGLSDQQGQEIRQHLINVLLPLHLLSLLSPASLPREEVPSPVSPTTLIPKVPEDTDEPEGMDGEMGEEEVEESEELPPEEYDD
jgi:hypothetical protein